ncbi:dihydrofolate reductase family protein [Mycobacterium sp. SMC-4]|uniref:dihydrofolate reductase family protein n=1 Tax=Mycobacterium sp. SMC-4 TaxID=2857059 RepID=UPI0021B24551|nr:dihydrofolate reductase family protein [Mycobacterium sp. SMC-4]UXA18356.1 dihydrofolate reductase family protein [Mycobacterium sp. SMC-4]
MACVYYTASSLDGFIVDNDDSLEWLTSRTVESDGPFAIEPFVAAAGALVMGAATYEWIAANHPGEWMYCQPSWVMTHRSDLVVDGHPVHTFAGSAEELFPQLVAAAGEKNVWVVGGGNIAAQFIAAGLVDEMVVAYAPCSLGAGARLLPMRSEWRLAESAVNGDFVIARWCRAMPS